MTRTITGRPGAGPSLARAQFGAFPDLFSGVVTLTAANWTLPVAGVYSASFAASVAAGGNRLFVHDYGAPGQVARSARLNGPYRDSITSSVSPAAWITYAQVSVLQVSYPSNAYPWLVAGDGPFYGPTGSEPVGLIARYMPQPGSSFLAQILHYTDDENPVELEVAAQAYSLGSPSGPLSITVAIGEVPFGGAGFTSSLDVEQFL